MPEPGNTMITVLEQAIQSLVNDLGERKSAYEILSREIPGEQIQASKYEIIKRRQNEIQERFVNSWTKDMKDLNALCRKIRNRQPHLSEIQKENINSSDKFPDALAFGRIRISAENFKGYVPRLVHFPFKKGIKLSAGSEISVEIIRQLLLRLLTALPAGRLKITACDPMELGNSLSPFLPLLKQNAPFEDKRIFTRGDEIEWVLQREADYLEDLLQFRFRGDSTDWLSYNINNPGRQLPYKVILLFGAPEQMNEKSIWYLNRLLQHGPKCGILPVITADDRRLEDRKYTALSESLNTYCFNENKLFTTESITETGLLNIEEEQEFWPADDRLADIISWLNDIFKEAGVFRKKLNELWDNTGLWQEDSTDGLSVPLGWSDSGDQVMFHIGGISTPQHVLMAGRSGSGKSNLLHVLIHNLSHKYSPLQLRLYLLDYKRGIEFYKYTEPSLPHAALIAAESDPEYGVTVLNHLIEELARREKEFKNNSAAELNEYRRKTGNIMPRILVIIDEFQMLFSENKQVAETAEHQLTALMRQGRSFGIHLLLATQTIRGIQSLSMGQLISQAGCRIALECSQEDSALVLGGTNWGAAQLKSPPEALINTENGSREHNRRFLVPFAEAELCRSHSSEMKRLAESAGIALSPKIFRGTQLPDMPEDSMYEDALIQSKEPALLMGKELDFEERPFFISFDKISGCNMLIAGTGENIRTGILSSIMKSLKHSRNISEVKYWNAGHTAHSILDIENLQKDPRFVFNSGALNNELPNYQYPDDGSYKIIIIDGLDYAKMLHGSAQFARPLKKEEDNPAEKFKKLLDEGPANGIFTLAFIDNWRRSVAQMKDLLSFFDLRIGFFLNEDDAGQLVSGNYGKMKGLENGTKVVYADRLRNLQCFFRPFVFERE
jgi:energy-coupling factor transporter ATP-binding protein EcfA2